LHDTYYLKGGRAALRERKLGTIIAVLTILAGAFICVAGTYVSIKVSEIRKFASDRRLMLLSMFQLIVVAYETHIVPKPFTC
jgi:hypothetical protein